MGPESTGGGAAPTPPHPCSRTFSPRSRSRRGRGGGRLCHWVPGLRGRGRGGGAGPPLLPSLSLWAKGQGTSVPARWGPPSCTAGTPEPRAGQAQRRWSPRPCWTPGPGQWAAGSRRTPSLGAPASASHSTSGSTLVKRKEGARRQWEGSPETPETPSPAPPAPAGSWRPSSVGLARRVPHHARGVRSANRCSPGLRLGGMSPSLAEVG